MSSTLVSEARGPDRKAVLVVDDSRTTRSYHAAIVSSAGYEVVTACDGVEALEALLTRQFSLVLTDINMPVMDGYELIRRVRGTAELAELPIVILTTEKDQSDRLEGFSAGANLYIVKPSSPQALADCVRMMVG